MDSLSSWVGALWKKSSVGSVSPGSRSSSGSIADWYCTGAVECRRKTLRGRGFRYCVWCMKQHGLVRGERTEPLRRRRRNAFM